VACPGAPLPLQPWRTPQTGTNDSNGPKAALRAGVTRRSAHDLRSGSCLVGVEAGVSDDSILSRWSHRKVQARNGSVPAESPAAKTAVALPVAVDLPPVVGEGASPVAPAVVPPPPSPPSPSLPTLEDVAQLTHDADFSRFVAPGVDASVKNAAMKKLFSDPHFNVMDGLDIYIDDYGIPDPIPEAMLRRMTQSKFMRLFDEDPSPPETDVGASLPAPAASPNGVAASALPQSHADAAGAVASEPELPLDEDTALRLQPDDAAGPAGAGPHRPGPRA
jgi:hypothetical protein